MPFLNHRNGEEGRHRNYFMINLHESYRGSGGGGGGAEGGACNREITTTCISIII